jgi:hypothetical protein
VACNWPESRARGSHDDLLLLVQHDCRTGVYGAERHLTAVRISPIEGGRSAELLALGAVDATCLSRAARGLEAGETNFQAEMGDTGGSSEGFGHVKSAVAVGELVVVVLQAVGGTRAACLSVAEGRSVAPRATGAAVTREICLEVWTLVFNCAFLQDPSHCQPLK